MNYCGFSFEDICDKDTEEIKNNSHAPNESNPQMIIHPSGCVMNRSFRNFIERIQNFEVFPDDIWVVTFPKCGTTWTQEMVWLLKNNLDYETAKSTVLRVRVPFMEFEAILSKVDRPEVYMETIDLAKNLSRPRCIKSHLPVELLPKGLWTVKPKIVYVVRDPKDVLISYYHHHRLWNGYEGTLENFADVFLSDRVVYSPYWSHVKGFLKLEDKTHILFNTFEEMKKDLPGVIRKTAKFLEVNLNDQQVEELGEHLSFKKMQENSSVNYMDLGNVIKKERNAETDENLNFIRKGEAGAWKTVLSERILEKFKAWNEHHLKNESFKEYPWAGEQALKYRV